MAKPAKPRSVEDWTRSLPPTFGDVLRLRVALRGIKPEVWRRVKVPAHLTFGALHEVLQAAFGWQNSHLHDFQVGEVRFGMGDVDDEAFVVDEHAAPLGAAAATGSKFLYRYDYGDDWEHEVVVERIEPGWEKDIECVDGANACPPEDCGGPPGYARMLEILANPDDEEYAEMKRWAPRGFDMKKFDVNAVNKKLAKLSKKLVRWPARGR